MKSNYAVEGPRCFSLYLTWDVPHEKEPGRVQDAVVEKMVFSGRYMSSIETSCRAKTSFKSCGCECSIGITI